jgi:hypothetical protein
LSSVRGHGAVHARRAVDVVGEHLRRSDTRCVPLPPPRAAPPPTCDSRSSRT